MKRNRYKYKPNKELTILDVILGISVAILVGLIMAITGFSKY